MPARCTTNVHQQRLVDRDANSGLRRWWPTGWRPPGIRQIPLRLTDGHPMPPAEDLHAPTIRVAFLDERAHAPKASPSFLRVGSWSSHALVSYNYDPQGHLSNSRNPRTPTDGHTVTLFDG
jgi:hypothetical protein